MADELSGMKENAAMAMEAQNSPSAITDNSATLENAEDTDSQKNINSIVDASAANAKDGLNFEVNLQPEKIVEVFKLSDGTQSYRVRWKDTWIHEQLILSYQNLVDEFWEQCQKAEQEKTCKQVDFALTDIRSSKLEEVTSGIKVIVLQPDDGDNRKGQEMKSNKEEWLLDNNKTSREQNDSTTDVPDEKLERSLKRKISCGTKKSFKKRARKAMKPVKKEEVEDEKENQDNPDDESSQPGDLSTSVSSKDDSSKESAGSSRKDKYQYNDEKGPCTCDICGKVISNKYGLREHQSVVHFKNGRFQCDICGKRVTNQRALNLHKTSHSNERKFSCQQCGSSHKTKGNLNYHIKTMHTMIKNFRCDICFKTFKVQAELKDHCFSTHANAGVITCIVCKKKLTTPLSIYTHSVMHSGAREYECDICGYAFKTLTGLKEHKVTHSENKPIRQCPYCERKFYSRSQYNAHVMRHTADGTLITYKCPMCDVKFQHKSSYNRHVIRHQPGGDLEFPKENPYLLLDEADLPEGVCHKCRKYYSSKSGFYLHLKKCRDGIVQQFPCPYCDRGCSNRSSLKRHIQRRHKDVEFEGETIQGQEILQKEDSVDNVTQTSVLTSQDGIQYQSTFFDHGYGNQITTVDVSQLPGVDVQLLLDTAAQADGQAHILGNVGQLTQHEEGTQNIHILSGHEAAQFAAQLSHAGVIVRSSDGPHENQNQQQLIVSSAQIDAHTGHIIVNGEGQSSQIITSNGLPETHHLDAEDTLLQGDRNSNILREENVLHFNNRTAVIQIQHANSNITNQQVLTISDQSELQDDNVGDLHQHTVTQLQTSQDISHHIDSNEHVEDEQFIQEEQIISNLADTDVEDHGYDSMGLLKISQT